MNWIKGEVQAALHPNTAFRPTHTNYSFLSLWGLKLTHIHEHTAYMSTAVTYRQTHRDAAANSSLHVSVEKANNLVITVMSVLCWAVQGQSKILCFIPALLFGGKVKVNPAHPKQIGSIDPHCRVSEVIKGENLTNTLRNKLWQSDWTCPHSRAQVLFVLFPEKQNSFLQMPTKTHETFVTVTTWTLLSWCWRNSMVIWSDTGQT